LEVNNWRWAGVPFRLRSGKSIGAARKEDVLRRAPHVPTGLTAEATPDRLRLVLGPEAMALEMNVNGENNSLTIDRVSMDTDLSPGRLAA
jgi:glucose-6-phosphate 1-dehydrogenase